MGRVCCRLGSGKDLHHKKQHMNHFVRDHKIYLAALKSTRVEIKIIKFNKVSELVSSSL